MMKISREDLGLLAPGMPPEAFAADSIARGVTLVVVTEGGEAVRAWTAGGASARVVPPEVRVVDTVGAGDTFCGYLGAALTEGMTFRAALALASTAASVACIKPGAQPAVPMREEVARSCQA